MFDIFKRKKEEERPPMYLIAGLGNPGKEYEMTRHNIGFHTIDYIAEQQSIKVKKLKFKALYGEGTIAGEKVYPCSINRARRMPTCARISPNSF